MHQALIDRECVIQKLTDAWCVNIKSFLFVSFIDTSKTHDGASAVELYMHDAWRWFAAVFADMK